MELTAEEGRVLGALIEKHMTTPDHYPLSTSALVTACNQTSNRRPVVEYDEDTVIGAVNGLRERGLARTVKRAGERAMKHLELADEGLDLAPRQKALLAVLLLRGAQTLGELRSRTERYVEFADLNDVEETLTAMATADIPTVEMLPRRPGQKEPRFRHLLGSSVDDGEEDDEVTEAEPSLRAHERANEIDLLREEVAELRAEVRELRRLVGGPAGQ